MLFSLFKARPPSFDSANASPFGSALENKAVVSLSFGSLFCTSISIDIRLLSEVEV